tara:strand:+ start:1017 stop:1742 length:726 start_codon:yes stop_codon:yes gene_type:complete
MNVKKIITTKKIKEKAEEPEEELEVTPESAEGEEPTLADMLPYLFMEPAEEEAKPKIRTLSLHGEVNEESASELIYSLMMLKRMGKKTELKDPEDPESEEITTYEPIELLISTHGGSASEMFGIYDTMRMVKKDCDVETFGIGKVMSAGVLLLSAGTKGKRKIMKNCRIMMHSVIGASHGALHSLENEMDEIRYLQEQHIDCLVEETDMTKRYLKKLMDRKVNVYLTAEQAVELGIADIII